MILLFRLDQTNNWRRLVDFKAGTSDNGLYVNSGRLNFYPSAQGSAPSIAAGQYVQVVLTRDGTTVAGYVNGAPQFSFTDGNGYGIINGANSLRLFKDNTTSDDSSGAVARIRLFAAAMPAGQVALLDRTDCSGAPRFLTPYLEANMLQLPVTDVIPGVSYRLLASTNLADWFGIHTGTPPANPAFFTDPRATNYSERFYRLVTP